MPRFDPLRFEPESVGGENDGEVGENGSFFDRSFVIGRVSMLENWLGCGACWGRWYAPSRIFLLSLVRGCQLLQNL